MILIAHVHKAWITSTVDSSPSHKPDWFRETIERWPLSGKQYMSRSKQQMGSDQGKDFKDQIWRCQRKVFQQKSGWVNIYYRIVQSSKITWAETLVERVFVLARFNTIKQESCHRRDVYAYLWLPSWIQINIQKKMLSEDRQLVWHLQSRLTAVSRLSHF